MIKKISDNIKSIYHKIKNNYDERYKYLAERGLKDYYINNKGFILIVVLIIIGMLIAVSSEFLMTAQTNIRYMQKSSDRLKALSLAESGIQLSLYILEADKKGFPTEMITGKSSDKNIDCYNDIWALDLPSLSIGDGSVKLAITDQNSKINLNALSTPVVARTPYYQIVEKFLLNWNISTKLTDSIIDWIDVDDSRSSYGAESSDYYLSLPNPYTTPNTGMLSIEDLLLVKGITPRIFYGIKTNIEQENDKKNKDNDNDEIDNNKGNTKLSFDMLANLDVDSIGTENQKPPLLKNDEYIKIAPEKSRRFDDYFRVDGENSNWLDETNKININTASYWVLYALTTNMSTDIVTQIISTRQQKPYKSIEEASFLKTMDENIKNIITVRSSIFQIEATATVGKTKVKISAIYNRDKKQFYFWSES